MPRGFHQDKSDLLIDLYGHTLVSEGSHWVKPFDLKNSASLLVSTAYITLLLESLFEQKFVECNVDGDADQYAINERGVLAAEDAVFERGITLDQFEADFRRRHHSGLIVSLDRDIPDISEARKNLKELEEHLQFDNDIGAISDDEKVVALQEVRELSETLSRPTIRLNALWTKEHDSLIWIIEKAAGSVAGELAKQALHSIQHFINVFFN